MRISVHCRGVWCIRKGASGLRGRVAMMMAAAVALLVLSVESLILAG
jgi:hypothetical protein